jgi:hypothetical protein
LVHLSFGLINISLQRVGMHSNRVLRQYQQVSGEAPG